MFTLIALIASMAIKAQDAGTAQRTTTVFWKAIDAYVITDTQVEFRWTVIEERNRGFYVEYSDDGITWSEIAFVPSRGVNEVTQVYSYYHNDLEAGRHYYRLRTESVTDITSMSETKSVVLKNTTNTVTVWPNPTTDMVTIDNTDKENVFSHAGLYDASGTLLVYKKLTLGYNNMQVSSLPQGIYILKLFSGSNQNFSQKLIKR
jgi:hypothetical protein